MSYSDVIFYPLSKIISPTAKIYKIFLKTKL